ncbi:MAG TPA: DNA repair protein RecO, partial [Chitinispirillaceae bacterium]|nr:DNA repair protein RecO [Chitinispirillaceae bacterium]
MSIDKTSAVVVSVIPWRETSVVVKLFTKEHGMISAAAKGVKRSRQLHTPIERGQIIDTLVYVHHNRTMQTLADTQIVAFYQSIRSDLEKTALRDLVLELLQKSIHDTNAHPELFELLVRCFTQLDESKERNETFASVWNYMRDFACLLGFGLTLEQCVSCGSAMDIHPYGGYLLIEQGGLVCRSCNCGILSPDYFVGSSSVAMIRGLSCEKQMFD